MAGIPIIQGNTNFGTNVISSQDQAWDNLARVVRNRYAAAKFARGQASILGKRVESWFGIVDNAMNKTHDQDTRVDFPGMIGYFGLTLLKTSATISKLKTTYQTALDAPVVLKPSDRPILPEDVKERARAVVGANLMARLKLFGLQPSDVVGSNGLDPRVATWMTKNADLVSAQLLDAEKKEAQLAADYHKAHMVTQFNRGGWQDASNMLLTQLTTRPYTVLCADYGPIIDFKWPNGRGAPTSKLILGPRYRTVAAELAFHGADSTNAQDGSGFTEVRFRTRSELLEMLALSAGAEGKRHGLDERNLRILLDEYQKKDLNWLTDNLFNAGTANANISDCSGGWSKAPMGRIMSLIHQGLFSARELHDAGITGHGDGLELMNVAVEVVGGRVIRLNVLKHPTSQREYYSASYKKVNDTPYGICPAMILHDRQREVNWLMYAKNRNAWQASGPSVVFNGAMFRDTENVKLSPFSQHWADTRGMTQNGGNSWGVHQVDVKPMFAALHEEIRRTMVLSDEECGVPALFSGLSRGGVGQTTLGGAVLQKTQGELGLDDAVINLDIGIIQPMCMNQYYNNLKLEKDVKNIRGDLNIIGRGINGLKDKELEQRLVTGALPLLMQSQANGLIPTEMLTGALKQYFDNSGIDSSALGSAGAQAEMAALGGAQPQQPTGSTGYGPPDSGLGTGTR